MSKSLKVENALLEAIWTMRWNKDKTSMYAIMEPEEAMKIATNIHIELKKIGYSIQKVKKHERIRSKKNRRRPQR
jgi:hypothetical protein